jgi:hypothetical protein
MIWVMHEAEQPVFQGRRHSGLYPTKVSGMRTSSIGAPSRGLRQKTRNVTG